ncbi:patatin-like phospholipase family protein [Danxiaibacter flavus]|uniref:Patatin-like phospholipase family protein n=1 Tax=Danxiaibacter flavus TaxID=3049108 RepID=A0ABV3ZIA5_9BACT|nr:patatin-like phospholipase family protein [Chitinophagaceae bacterium DXS]
MLKIEDFTNNPDVKECVERLEREFGSNGRPFVVSDVLDSENHQYVNLVQKGGGVLGVALVGYTYILEYMGIRFMRLAGTSAGAINTSLMTVIGRKEEAKSDKVLDAICKLNFFNLVDGHPVARMLIKNFITNTDFNSNVKKWIAGIVITLLFFVTGDFVCLGLQKAVPWVSVLTKTFFILTGFFLLILAVLLVYISTLLKRLKNSGFGINPGDYFYDWIKQQLQANGVHTVDDLNKKAAQEINGLYLRVPHEEGIADLKGDVTFITSELVTENKIQFPAMCNLFRKAGDINSLQPAGFIRASMSIPVFFESYFINDIPCTDQDIKDVWLKTFGETDPPSTARFVDGGILSNFPINLFYNPKVLFPRLPSFGIDLDDTKPDDSAKTAENWSLAGYFGRMFNTIRFYYDKDFLIKNQFFKKGIGTIQLADFNWLNFFITDKDKIEMFVRGAKAATDFLIQFDWDAYKNERSDMQQKLLSEQKTSESKSRVII